MNNLKAFPISQATRNKKPMVIMDMGYLVTEINAAIAEEAKKLNVSYNIKLTFAKKYCSLTDLGIYDLCGIYGNEGYNFNLKNDAICFTIDISW